MRRRQGSRLTHPRMMRRLEKTHFNSTCAIGIEIIIYDTFNQPVGTGFAPYPRLQAIPCYKEPLSTQIPPERSQPNQVIITDKFVIALAGYYPSIRSETDSAKINERVYNITGVTSDDTDTITFLNVEIVNKPVDNAA